MFYLSIARGTIEGALVVWMICDVLHHFNLI